MRGPADLSELSFRVQQILESTMGRMVGARRVVMFSGGFDSMLMALLAQRCGAKVTAVTVRFDGFNPRTVAQASLLARKLGLAHRILHVTLLEFLSAFGALAALIDKPLLDLDLVLVQAAFKKYDPQMGGKVFISGMGSDQWLGNESLKGKAKDLQVRLNQAAADRKVHQKVARAYGYKFIFPFLSTPMLAFSQQVPKAFKKDKKLLRQLVSRTDIDLLSGLQANREIQVPAPVRQLLQKVYGQK